jgi:formylglycine-generating enzyme required for sulfatase activity
MHIFISYAKADSRDLALQLRDAFTTLPDVTAWMDTSLHSGEDWAGQIQEEIDRADLVIVLLSQDINRPADHPNGRSFVLKEIHYAQQGKKTIIPVMAQTTRVPVQLAGIEYINFVHDPSAGLKRLINEVSALAQMPASAPAPASSLGANDRTAIPVLPVAARDSKLPAGANRLRSPGFIIVVVGLVASVLIAIGIPIFNGLTSSTPTDTPMQTATSTTIPTGTSTQASTSTTMPTDVSDDLGQAGKPVTHNADWKPQYNTFDGYDMVLVPAGCFMMGSTSGMSDETPVNEQCFDQPFWIDRYEVTNKQYGSAGQFRGDNRPRERISWFDAFDFCVKRGAKLPTEREWEYAARGPDGLFFPWGNDWLPDNTVFLRNSNNQTANVGSRTNGNSWVGASDLSGNVWEWMSTIYGVDKDLNFIFFDKGDKLFLYPYDATDGREQYSTDSTFLRVLKGGSWGIDNPTELRSAGRTGAAADGTNYDMGFRCVRAY